MIVLLALAVLLGVGLIPFFRWRTTLQDEIRRAGYLPLGTFDLIQIIPAEGQAQDGTTRVSSSQVLIGSVLPWSENTVKHSHEVLQPTISPLRPTYSFGMRLQHGPKQIMASLQHGLKSNDVKLGSWVESQFDGQVHGNLVLRNVWLGVIDLGDEYAIPFFVAAEPLRSGERQSTVLWITQFVAADVSNQDQIGVKVKAGAAVPDFPLAVTVGHSETAELAGPGLLLGVRGWLIETKLLGQLQETPLPSSRVQPLSFPIDGESPIDLLVDRRDAENVYFDFRSAGGKAFVKKSDDSWTIDRAPSGPVAVSLTRGRGPAAAIGDGITRLILVRSDLSGSHTTAISMAIYKRDRDGTYIMSGRAYELGMRAIPEH